MFKSLLMAAVAGVIALAAVTTAQAWQPQRFVVNGTEQPTNFITWGVVPPSEPWSVFGQEHEAQFCVLWATDPTLDEYGVAEDALATWSDSSFSGSLFAWTTSCTDEVDDDYNQHLCFAGQNGEGNGASEILFLDDFTIGGEPSAGAACFDQTPSAWECDVVIRRDTMAEFSVSMMAAALHEFGHCFGLGHTCNPTGNEGRTDYWTGNPLPTYTNQVDSIMCEGTVTYWDEDTGCTDLGPCGIGPDDYATINLYSDLDFDGCSGWEEVNDRPRDGQPELTGGLRDPFNVYDFADVNANGSVDLSDVLAVLDKFGLNPGQPGYDPRMDVRLVAGSTWKTEYAGDGITLTDALAVNAQFGHSCADGP